MDQIIHELTAFCYKFIAQCSIDINNSFYHKIHNIFEKCHMDYDENHISIDEKLLAIYMVLSQQAGKTNGIIFVGPPGSGKSLFMQILASDFRKIGNFNILNLKSEFALDDLVDANIAIGDEIIFENMNVATYFNLLLEGSPNLKLSIKHKPKVEFQKIPVMIASNQVPWLYTSQVRPATLDRAILISTNEHIDVNIHDTHSIDKKILSSVKNSMFVSINKYFNC